MDGAAASVVLACTADLEAEALGDFTGVALACGLGTTDFPGVTFAADGAARFAFVPLEAGLSDFRAEVGNAAAGDARLTEAGVFETPPLTTDLGVLAGEALAGDALAAAGDLAAALLDFAGVTFAAALGDFTGALPFLVVSRAFRAAITSDTK